MCRAQDLFRAALDAYPSFCEDAEGARDGADLDTVQVLALVGGVLQDNALQAALHRVMDGQVWRSAGVGSLPLMSPRAQSLSSQLNCFFALRRIGESFVLALRACSEVPPTFLKLCSAVESQHDYIAKAYLQPLRRQLVHHRQQQASVVGWQLCL